jgi:hypothetical protein
MCVNMSVAIHFLILRSYHTYTVAQFIFIFIICIYIVVPQLMCETEGRVAQGNVQHYAVSFFFLKLRLLSFVSFIYCIINYSLSRKKK